MYLRFFQWRGYVGVGGWGKEEKGREEREETEVEEGKETGNDGWKKNERDSSWEYCNEFSLKAMKREQEKV